MNDDHYPSVDFEFVESLLIESDRVADVVSVGDTRAYVLKGSSPSHKRTLYLRKTLDRQVTYLKATGLAIRVGRIADLSDWFEVHRKWKDGAYIERD